MGRRRREFHSLAAPRLLDPSGLSKRFLVLSLGIAKQYVYVEAKFGAKRKEIQRHHVWGHNAGSARQILVSARPGRDLISKNVMVQAMVRRQICKGRKWWGQGRGWVSACSEIREFRSSVPPAGPNEPSCFDFNYPLPGCFLTVNP